MFFALEEGPTNFEFSSRWPAAVLSLFIAAQNRIRSQFMAKNMPGRASPDQVYCGVLYGTM